MLVKTNKKTRSGRDIYMNALTGKETVLKRATGKHTEKIPDYVFRSFRNPAPDKWEYL